MSGSIGGRKAERPAACRASAALLVGLMLPLAGSAWSQDALFSVDRLIELLSADPVERRAFEALSPEWVGTVRTVFPEPGEGVEEPVDIRFSHGAIFKSVWPPGSEEQFRGVIARLRTDSYISAEGPQYRESLPTTEKLAKCVTAGQLEKLLGPSQYPTTGWGGLDGRMHTTAGWTFFTRLEKDRLRYLGVDASISSSEKEKESRIDSLRVKEGFFRPADPQSAEEKKKYLSGEILGARDEAKKKAKRDKYARPLRDLLEANEAPGDSDLKVYGAFLNEFRQSPDPKLLRQIMAHAHSDSVKYQMFLEAIFGDRIASMVEELKDWDPDKRREALGYLIDALAESQGTDALWTGSRVVLESLGGGKLQLRDPDSKAKIDVKVRKNGGYTYRDFDYSPGLVKLVQEELRLRLKKANGDGKIDPPPSGQRANPLERKQ